RGRLRRARGGGVRAGLAPEPARLGRQSRRRGRMAPLAVGMRLGGRGSGRVRADRAGPMDRGARRHAARRAGRLRARPDDPRRSRCAGERSERPMTLTMVDVHLTDDDLEAQLREDVRAGLASVPKSLPPKWFYDERGGELFEEITRLPEYYPTRTERALLL